MIKGRHLAMFGGNVPIISNKYKVIQEVARGGMSVVHEGVRKSDDTRVAIKLIIPEFKQLADQLELVFDKGSEGEIAISLRHPNVIRTFDYGSTGRGYYIIMQFVDGPNLKQLIDVGNVRWSQNRLNIALQVGRGLAYIHKYQLIHRDFCPKNILLAGDGTAKIIDFGLAIPAHLKEKWRWDRSGTAAYMAPEQVRGQQVDQRTDVYGYGVTAYEILTGRRPFPENRDKNRKMAAHLNAQPISPRRFNRHVPVALEHVLFRAMSKNAEDRYEDVATMVKEMAAVISTFFGLESRLPEK